jgi:hypothetical protein
MSCFFTILLWLSTVPWLFGQVLTKEPHAHATLAAVLNEERQQGVTLHTAEVDSSGLVCETVA